MGLRAAPNDVGDPEDPNNTPSVPKNPTITAPGAPGPALSPQERAQIAQQTTDGILKALPTLTQQRDFYAQQESQSPGGRSNPNDPNSASWAALRDDATKQIGDNLAYLKTTGLGPGGVPMTAAESAAVADAQARLAVDAAHYQNQDAQAATNESDRAKQQDAATAETVRANKATEAEQQAKDAETQRQNNVTGTLDYLQQQIAMGNMTAQQARDKAQAAYNSAEVQRQTIADNSPWALPAGAQYMPGLGPTDNIASLAGSMGLPFSPLATGGTHTLDPNAIAAPITAAANSPQPQNPAMNQAMQNVAAALAAGRVPAGAAA